MDDYKEYILPMNIEFFFLRFAICQNAEWRKKYIKDLCVLMDDFSDFSDQKMENFVKFVRGMDDNVKHLLNIFHDNMKKHQGRKYLFYLSVASLFNFFYSVLCIHISVEKLN